MVRIQILLQNIQSSHGLANILITFDGYLFLGKDAKTNTFFSEILPSGLSSDPLTNDGSQSRLCRVHPYMMHCFSFLFFFLNRSYRKVVDTNAHLANLWCAKLFIFIYLCTAVYSILSLHFKNRQTCPPFSFLKRSKFPRTFLGE